LLTFAQWTIRIEYTLYMYWYIYIYVDGYFDIIIIYLILLLFISSYQVSFVSEQNFTNRVKYTDKVRAKIR